MPEILKRAQDIAKEAGHPILLVDFQRTKDRDECFPNGAWDRAARKLFVKWLTTMPQIPWEKCFPPLSEDYIMCPYTGMIAIPVCEQNHPEMYKLVVEEWENPDMSPKVENIRLFILNN
jgi:hypothetical protein